MKTNKARKLQDQDAQFQHLKKVLGPSKFDKLKSDLSTLAQVILSVISVWLAWYIFIKQAEQANIQAKQAQQIQGFDSLLRQSLEQNQKLTNILTSLERTDQSTAAVLESVKIQSQLSQYDSIVNSVSGKSRLILALDEIWDYMDKCDRLEYDDRVDDRAISQYLKKILSLMQDQLDNPYLVAHSDWLEKWLMCADRLKSIRRYPWNKRYAEEERELLEALFVKIIAFHAKEKYDRLTEEQKRERKKWFQNQPAIGHMLIRRMDSINYAQALEAKLLLHRFLPFPLSAIEREETHLLPAYVHSVNDRKIKLINLSFSLRKKSKKDR